MIDRRKFIIASGVTTFGVLTGIEGRVTRSSILANAAEIPIANTDPRKALVLWYSQTGHTARIGRLLAKTLESEGLTVDCGPMAKTDPAEVVGYDLLIFGTPVQYMDVPANVTKWLSALPDLTGIPAASWVTFGGPGDNYYNTACGVLELVAEKNAVPVGLDTFGNMSTFAPTWSALGSVDRILEYRDRPNRQTYEKARQYARTIVKNVRERKPFEVEREFSISGALTIINPMWWSKQLINRHEIDLDKCVGCYTCSDTCPVGAISPDYDEVDRSACLACLGCINNCPEGAIVMEYLCRPVYGWKRFCKENNIEIPEPREAP
jgi:ferredoxin/flavodoxin